MVLDYVDARDHVPDIASAVIPRKWHVTLPFERTSYGSDPRLKTCLASPPVLLGTAFDLAIKADKADDNSTVQPV